MILLLFLGCIIFGGIVYLVNYTYAKSFIETLTLTADEYAEITAGGEHAASTLLLQAAANQQMLSILLRRIHIGVSLVILPTVSAMIGLLMFALK